MINTEILIKKVDFLGLEIVYDRKDKIIDEIVRLIENGKTGYIVVTNVSGIVLFQEDLSFQKALKKSLITVSDSTILQKIISIKKRIPYTPVYYGVDLMMKLCAVSEKIKIKIGLLGGQDKIHLDDISSRLKNTYSGLEISYLYSPPFQPIEKYNTNKIISEVKNSCVDLLFIGIGYPKQELLMDKLGRENSFISIGVGAAFDTISGKNKRSPAIFHKVGLEWLYRLILEPKRLWKRVLISSPKIFLLLFK